MGQKGQSKDDRLGPLISPLCVRCSDDAIIAIPSLRRLPAPSARDTGPVGVTEVQPTMVYRRGVFLRQEIETINNVAIAPRSAVDLALNDLGIFLELSYEDL